MEIKEKLRHCIHANSAAFVILILSEHTRRYDIEPDT